MVRIARWMLFVCALASGHALAQSYFAQAQHTFQGPEGAQPQTVAAAPDGSFYGISQNGGSGHGTLFHAAGGTVNAVHDFTGSDGSMQFPSCCSHGALAQVIVAPSGDVYGYTLTGGNTNCQSGYGCGVIFHYSPSSGFSVLWKFTGGSDGSTPSGLVFASDGNLYGSSSGGTGSSGAVFKLSTSGSLQVLHTFCSLPNCADGVGPDGLAEGPDHNFYGHYYGVSTPDYIYRITPAGVITPLVSLSQAVGNNWGQYAGNFVTGTDGAIYFTFDRDSYGSGRLDRYDIGTNVLAMLHQFDYTDADPPYRLALGSDGSIYGTAAGGGRQGLGTTFRVVTPANFGFLYDFQGGLDGAAPTGIAQTANGSLFGVAANGGIAPAGSSCASCGTFFQLLAMPAGSPIVKTFDPASGPMGTKVTVSGSQFTGTVALQFGAVPGGFNVQSDQTLTTNVPVALPGLSQFAITNGAGTGYGVEPFQTSAYQYSTLYGFCPGSPYPYCSDGGGPGSLIQSVDGNFYGTTSFNYPSSVLFKLTPSGAESVLATGLNLPNAIVESGAYLYGTSRAGGYYGLATGCNGGENPTGCGTVFRVNRSSGAVDLLYKFKGLADGAFPRGNLVAMSGGNFYGTTASTLFRLRGTALQTVRKFTAATDGGNPASLLNGQDGNVYGVNATGGAANLGTVFRYSPATSSFQVLHSFGAGEGSAPASLVRTTDGTLYGVTQSGGANGQGSLFRIDTAGNFSTVFSFPGSAALGASPGHIVLGKDGALYGFTTGGAALGAGALFRLGVDGSGGTVLYSFFPSSTASSHGSAPTSLLQGSNGDWYGTTYTGGATTCAYGQGCGEVFHVH